MKDYVLKDMTNASHWPGSLPWRSFSSKRGYKDAEEAQIRARVIRDHYAAKTGQGGPDLQVFLRVRSGSKLLQFTRL